jgi:hypothetical protein
LASIFSGFPIGFLCLQYLIFSLNPINASLWIPIPIKRACNCKQKLQWQVLAGLIIMMENEGALALIFLWDSWKSDERHQS